MTDWFRERLPAVSDSAHARELVLLHGWACSSDIWRSALPRLRRHFNVTLIDLPGHGRSGAWPLSAADCVEQLAAQLPDGAIVLGWSLGGMLATALAQRHPGKVSALITVSTNAKFVAQKDWPDAMPPATFATFLRSFNADTGKTLKRFGALQFHGDQNAGHCRRQWTALTSGGLDSDLDSGLDWLGALDNREALAALTCPALHLFGERDALVPLGAAQSIATLNSAQTVATLSGAGHMPFLTASGAFWKRVIDFCDVQGLLPTPTRPAIDKQQVARSFSRAAASYDGVADLQRRVADRLFATLPDGARADTLLDLGCGTGYSLPALRQVARRVLALDLAQGMVSYAREHRAADAWLCADAENLPVADASLDVVFSSLSLQWCENLAATFAEAYRVLTPGGMLALSTLGPETLFEMRRAWQSVDAFAHVNRFADRPELERAVLQSGLTLCLWREQREVLEYTEVRELMNELKKLGAHNLNSARAGGLTGKQRLRRFIEGYEPFRRDGRLPATYQVWYLVLEKPRNVEAQPEVALG